MKLGVGAMSVELEPHLGGKVLIVRATGQLSAEHYRRMIPKFEALIQEHGKISLLVEMKDFHGWTVGALWEDLKLSLRHFSDIDRVAIVGEKRWEEWMAAFCKPFTRAKIRYFDQSEAAEARVWIEAEETTPST